MEWRVRKSSLWSFGKQAMKGWSVQVPQQDNNTDCGVYVLQYVESFITVSMQHVVISLLIWWRAAWYVHTVVSEYAVEEKHHATGSISVFLNSLEVLSILLYVISRTHQRLSIPPWIWGTGFHWGLWKKSGKESNGLFLDSTTNSKLNLKNECLLEILFDIANLTPIQELSLAFEMLFWFWMMFFCI